MTRQAEIVIIGGGIVGCAAAYYLARRGLAPLLLEGREVAGQQSGRNWGFVRQQGRDPLELPLMMESNRLWQGLEAELGADMEWVQGGNLALAASEERMALFEEWLGIARSFGLDTRLLRRRDLEAVAPGMHGSWVGGMYTPSDGHAEPAKATEAFARAAAAHGATVRTGCMAESLLTANGEIAGVSTEAEEIRTTRVVCAAGAWSAPLLRTAGLRLPRRLVRATVARTNPAPPITRAGVWGPAVAFRQRRDGRLNLAAGGATDYDVTLDAFRHLRLFWPNYWKNRKLFRFHVGRPLGQDLARLWPGSRGRHAFPYERDADPRPNPDKVHGSLSEFRRLFPGLPGLAIERSWAGYIDVMPDAVPVLDEAPTPRGLIVATGFSGHGFAMGPIVGRLIAELVADGKASLDIRGFRLARFAEGTAGTPRSVL
ncbi:MAG: FAD-dependent oxidoreductase [Candidatus Rokuibacteriota bacterium]|nr:MAG: FAD-dependent oxidoreductase [Candidatus Rokubacteria bacterium]